MKQRNQELQRRRSTQYEQAAIAGSARMLMEFEGPGYEIISIPTPRTRRRPKPSASSEADVSEKIAPKTVRIKSPKSQLSLPVGNDIRAYHHSNKHTLFENTNSPLLSNGNSTALIPPRLVDGYDLMQLGVPQGPAMRGWLEEIQTRQLEGVLRTKEEALEWVREQTAAAGVSPKAAENAP